MLPRTTGQPSAATRSTASRGCGPVAAMSPRQTIESTCCRSRSSSTASSETRLSFRAPHRHLWLQPTGRYPRRRCEFGPRRRALRRRHRRSPQQQHAHDRRPHPADVRPAQCAELARRDRRRAGVGARRRGAARGARRLQRREAPLHQGRRMRTASPSSTITAITRSRSPPCCSAARDATAGSVIAVVQPHRYYAARQTSSTNSAPASTMPTRSWSPMSIPRARHRSKASPRRAGRGPARARPSQCAAAGRARALAATIAASAKPGDLVVCLGAGSITNWAPTCRPRSTARGRSARHDGGGDAQRAI